MIFTLLISCDDGLPEELSQLSATLPETVDYNFHIQPILSDRCYKCHGPDDNTREADLRLDLEDEAFSRFKDSRGFAFVRGNPKRSQAWQRIMSEDAKVKMPPPESHLALSDYEKGLIYRWIEQGAAWKKHWAFIPPQQTEVPPIENENAVNEIDHFLLNRMQQQGLSPAPTAPRQRLIRRLFFDLTGLPPEPKDINTFLSNTDPAAYAELVDQLLDSDAHAERLTMHWLDLARFGDTQGMHFDGERYNWPWRDWVINAFRTNMPYDQFLLEQMAGDLLPNATRDQKLATVFHRNHPTSSEGGVPDEEFRQQYVQDRTNTTATAFLGLTLGCASCHDHKFDPISQEEYYQMSAFFNNIKEVGMVNEFLITPGGGPVYPSGPVLIMTDSLTEVRISEIDGQLDSLHATCKQRSAQIVQTDQLQTIAETEIKSPQPDAHFPFEHIAPHTIEDAVVHRIQNLSPIHLKIDGNTQSLACGNPEVVPGKIGNALRSPEEMDLVFLKGAGTFELNEPYSAGAWIKPEKSGANQSIFGTGGELGNAWRGWDLYLDTLDRPTIRLASLVPHNYVEVRGIKRITANEWQHVLFTYNGTASAQGLRLYLNGAPIETEVTYDNLYGSLVHRWNKNRKEWPERPILVFRSGRYHLGENGVFKGSIDDINIIRRVLTPLQVNALVGQMRGEFHTDLLIEHALQHDRPYLASLEQIRQLVGERKQLLVDIPEVQVMEEMPDVRPTFVLNRGQYDQPTKRVFPGTPREVMPFADNLPANRLGLAQWMLDPEHPLTARVAVNRFWQMIFGRGLVSTPEDFGTQGALPSHPELLDWLALDFIESGWDVRRLLKMMVMTSTYQQQSESDPQSRDIDPHNIYLSRSPSYRLPAEMIRDHALAASNLLVQKMGGPSVKPYQPEGIWNFGVTVSGPYVEGTGQDLYRRSMYTYIRRTAPHPAMLAFDAPNRLVCTTRREVTSTPLQALVLLNDPQFVEAARVLAEAMFDQGGSSLDEQLNYGFLRLCGRRASADEMRLLQDQYLTALDKFRRAPATELFSVGAHPAPRQARAEIAALAMTANTMMNFDEFYMKR